jgi:hypothetical protein
MMRKSLMSCACASHRRELQHTFDGIAITYGIPENKPYNYTTNGYWLGANQTVGTHCYGKLHPGNYF